MPQYLSQQDYQQFGPELVDFAQRAAADAMAPQIDHLAQQNDLLRQRLAVEARHRLDAAVEAAVPNFREIDADPRWHSWLLGNDSLSGRQRQSLLDESIRSGSASRTVSFFRQFLREAGLSGQAAPAQGRARTSASGPTYTPATIKQLYEAKRRGAYAGREEAWSRQENDIFAAQREGRVQSTPYLTK